MDCGNWIAFVSCVVALISCVIAGAVFLFTRMALRYQILAQLMRDYADPAMGEHVKTLHETCRPYKSDWSGLETKLKTDVSDFKKNLNKARRPVSHFYQRLAVLYKHSWWFGKCFFGKIIFVLWSERDLRIIPDIIMPLETALVQSRNEKLGNELDLLWDLYKAAKKRHKGSDASKAKQT